MGRHRDEQAAAASGAEGSGFVVLGIVAVLALVLVGFGVRGLFFSDTSTAEGDGGTAAPADPTSEPDDAETSTVPDMGEGEGATDAAEETQTARSEDDSEPSQTEPEAPEALQLCQSEVAAGDAYAAATATAAANWEQHYSASVQYNAGDISLEDAEEEFAESKAKGPADMDAVDSTRQDYNESQGACTTLETAELSQEWTAEANDCVERSAALAQVAQTGDEVTSDWDEHLQMMAAKDESDPAEYYERWQSMVMVAPDAMESYNDSADALGGAPTC